MFGIQGFPIARNSGAKPGEPTFPEKGRLGPELVALGGAAVVVSDHQPIGETLLEAAELLEDDPAEWHHGLVAATGNRGMPAQAPRGP
jgi:hypothetical protein